MGSVEPLDLRNQVFEVARKFSARGVEDIEDASRDFARIDISKGAITPSTLEFRNGGPETTSEVNCVIGVGEYESAEIALSSAELVLKTEIVVEFGDKEGPVTNEFGDVRGVLETSSEPLFGISFEKRPSEHDFGGCRSIEVWGGAETDLVFANPGMQFFAMSSIEKGWVPCVWVFRWIGWWIWRDLLHSNCKYLAKRLSKCLNRLSDRVRWQRYEGPTGKVGLGGAKYRDGAMALMECSKCDILLVQCCWEVGHDLRIVRGLRRI